MCINVREVLRRCRCSCDFILGTNNKSQGAKLGKEDGGVYYLFFLVATNCCFDKVRDMRRHLAVVNQPILISPFF
jgi:hypothetical protein